MANVERTGKQKALLVLSIIGIIFGALVIISGIVILGGGALVSLGGAESLAAGQLTAEDQATVATAGGLASLLGVLLLLSGGFTLLTGIFGIRGANDAAKIMPYIVCAVITLILDVVSLFATGITASAIIGIVIAAIMVWLGFAIRSEAGISGGPGTPGTPGEPTA